MNCANHTDVAAVAYCRTCGKALCASCTRDVQGTVYCESCLAARLNQGARPAGIPVPPGTPVADTSPGLALFLGMIPGAGAMYNGQFAKGVIHALIFATCIFLADHGLGPIGGIMIATWWFYMVFDAYTTAKARKYGQPLPDPFGFNRTFGAYDAHHYTPAGEKIGQGVEEAFHSARQSFVNAQQNYGSTQPPYAPPPVVEAPPEPAKGIPMSAFVLIGIGVLFLLSTLDVFRFDVGRFWPVILIAVGIWLLIKRRNAVAQ